MVRILITIITIMVLVKTRKSPFVTSVYDASVYDATNDASVCDESYGRGITGYLCGSRGLSARRVRRTKSSTLEGPKVVPKSCQLDFYHDIILFLCKCNTRVCL